MARNRTGLEEAAELARRINRWLALRSEDGDERAYRLAESVQRLHSKVLAKSIELEAGLVEIEPILHEVRVSQGGGKLFAEARALVATLDGIGAAKR